MTNALKSAPWMLAAITSLLYFAGAKAGVYGSTLVEGITIIWPPNAFLLVALIIAPYRHWLWILPGILAAEIMADTPTFTVIQAISFGLVNIFECTLAAWLLKYFSRTSTFSLYSVHSVMV